MSLRLAMRMASPPGASAALSILLFHRVLPRRDPLFPDEPDVDRFDAILGWLGDWFNVLPLDEAIVRMRAGTLPARAAAITFDDGYADNHEHALPVLLRHGMHATFFVASGFLDGGRMWNDSVIEAVRETQLEQLESGIPGVPVYGLGGIDDRRAAIQGLLKTLKHMPPQARTDAVEGLIERCRVELPGDLMLSMHQLRGLREAGMSIGAHTTYHPILAACDPALARREIADGRDQLEAALGQRVGLFAYPNGKARADYRREHVDMVAALGFDAAVTTNWGVNRRDAEPYQLARFTPWDRSRWRFGLRMLDNYRNKTPDRVE